MTRRLISAGLVALLALGDAAFGAQPAPRPVVLRFSLRAGTRPIACGDTIAQLGASGAAARLRDARFFVSQAALVDARGRETPIVLKRDPWQYADVALLDFQNGAAGCAGPGPTHDAIEGVAPPGRYKGLRFTLGVPNVARVDGAEVALNHSNVATAPPPLDLPSMGWSWQAGRKFLKIEIDPAGGVRRAASAEPAVAATFMLHLGSTGCRGYPATGEIVSCVAANRLPLRFAAFDPARERIVLDLSALFAGVDVTRDGGGATGCMSGPSDPECAPLFANIGLNLVETEPDANDAGKPSRGGSRLFRIERRQ